MKKFGITLLILQVLAFIGCLIGSAGLPKNGFAWFGFFLPSIIGIILIAKGSKKKDSEEQTTKEKELEDSTGNDITDNDIGNKKII